MTPSFLRTLKLKVRGEAYRWLDAAATEVNQVFNYCNEISYATATRTDLARKRLSGFDLCSLSAGAGQYFDHIGADTIQRVCMEYAQKRTAAKRLKLRWRESRGAHRSLGWIPFKAANIKRKGRGVRFCGKSFRIFEAERLDGVKWQQGCFAQDAVGDWWLCLPVDLAIEESIAPKESVGIDLGLKAVAMTSDGERLQAGQFYRRTEPRIAMLQRRGHRRQAKRLHRKVARQRQDACHKFSRMIVDQYQNIYVGDVSSSKLARTRMAKSVHDAGWGMLRRMLQYKGEHAGRSVTIVDESYTSRVCSSCGGPFGPSGLRRLVVRTWQCALCGDWHDRHVNAARNMVGFGSRCWTSVRGNELSQEQHPVEPDIFVRATDGRVIAHALA
jgi:putative transposase